MNEQITKNANKNVKENTKEINFIVLYWFKP